MRLSTLVFVACLLVWGHQLCQAGSDLGPSHQLVVASKYIKYTSRTVTGDQNTDYEGDPDKDEYFIQFMNLKTLECVDMEFTRQDYENTQVGQAWEYRVRLADDFTIFRRIPERN